MSSHDSTHPVTGQPVGTPAPFSSGLLSRPGARHQCPRPLPAISFPVPAGRACDWCYTPLTDDELAAGSTTTPPFDLARPIPRGSTIEWLPVGATTVWRPDIVVADLRSEVVVSGNRRVPRERILAVYAPDRA